MRGSYCLAFLAVTLLTVISCVPFPDATNDQIDVWRQLWHLTTRAISVPGTSRAGCVLLHAILEMDILPYHIISDDVNNIVTTPDVNGPSVLCDASITLMLLILHVRNSRIPSASQNTCHHIIRWTFLRWSPGKPTSLGQFLLLT